MFSKNKTRRIARGLRAQVTLIWGDAGAATSRKQGSVGWRGGPVGTVLNTKPLGAELGASGSHGAVTKRAGVWEAAHCLGWHDGNTLESTHILQPGEETLGGSHRYRSNTGEDQCFNDPKQEAGAGWKSQAVHVYKRTSSSGESLPK